QIILEANGLWETIEPLEKTQSDNRKDKTDIVFLYQDLPKEQLIQITKHKSVKAIWDALKTRHIGEQRVQQARLQTLKFEFEMLHMKEEKTIDTFTEKLTTLVNKATSLRHTIQDQTLVRKLLNVVPDRYLQIVASIEQYFDLSEMTMEEAIGRLKTYEERIKEILRWDPLPTAEAAYAAVWKETAHQNILEGIQQGVTSGVKLTDDLDGIGLLRAADQTKSLIRPHPELIKLS
nr:zinc finger, CCHC-type [Tanacetum cinerariifolium]